MRLKTLITCWKDFHSIGKSSKPGVILFPENICQCLENVGGVVHCWSLEVKGAAEP